MKNLFLFPAPLEGWVVSYYGRPIKDNKIKGEPKFPSPREAWVVSFQSLMDLTEKI